MRDATNERADLIDDQAPEPRRVRIVAGGLRDHRVGAGDSPTVHRVGHGVLGAGDPNLLGLVVIEAALLGDQPLLRGSAGRGQHVPPGRVRIDAATGGTALVDEPARLRHDLGARPTAEGRAVRDLRAQPQRLWTPRRRRSRSRENSPPTTTTAPGPRRPRRERRRAAVPAAAEAGPPHQEQSSLRGCPAITVSAAAWRAPAERRCARAPRRDRRRCAGSAHWPTSRPAGCPRTPLPRRAPGWPGR